MFSDLIIREVDIVLQSQHLKRDEREAGAGLIVVAADCHLIVILFGGERDCLCAWVALGGFLGELWCGVSQLIL